MQYIDRENRCVTDYMDNYRGKGRSGQIVGIRILFRIRSSENQRLRRQKLRTAEKKRLTIVGLPEKEFEWDVQPVVTVDSIERFPKGLKELSSFTAGFTTRRYLDSTAQEGGKAPNSIIEWPMRSEPTSTEISRHRKTSFFPSAGRKLKGTVTTWSHSP